LKATDVADRSALVAGRVCGVCAAALVGSICLSAAPAIAIDGTWTGTTNTDWNTDTNWSPGPTPNNTASFANNGAPTSVSIGNLTSINTIQFLAGAPTYSFTFLNGPIFNINGSGIINNSSNVPIFGPGQIFLGTAAQLAMPFFLRLSNSLTQAMRAMPTLPQVPSSSTLAPQVTRP
jgi:hypothetical protein